MKYLHLVDDEKSFTDLLISRFESAAPGQNVYLLGQHDGRQVADVSQKHLLTIRRAGSAEYLNFASGMPALRAVYAHFLTQTKASAVARVPDTVNRVWLAWGGDFYDHCWSPRRLYQPITYAFLRRDRGQISPSLRYWARRALNRMVPSKDALRQAAALFDYCVTVAPPEQDILRRALGMRALQLRFNYGSMRSILGERGEVRAQGEDILVGNSSTPTSNHVDMFRMLADSSSGRGQVIVPLSYGDAGAYLDFVRAAGRRFLGSRFKPVTEFIPTDEYVRLLARCSTCIFNHERQQAVGNILVALWLGARVFLRPTSPVYRHLSNLGVRMFRIDASFSRTLERSVLDKTDAERNRVILEREYGEETAIRQTRDLLAAERPK